MRRLKDISENATKVSPGDVVGIDAHCSVAKIQRADVVEAENMIDVAMRDQNGVEMADLCPQGLLAKVDRCIDKDLFIAVFN